MGKKRIIKKSGHEVGAGKKRASSKVSRKKMEKGILHIMATYNNTNILLSDLAGNAVLSSSSGSLGFKGSKKGTPYAAGKAGEELADKAGALGLKEVDVVIKGVGSGRESAIRSFITKGINISSIRDKTPIPFNGPKPKKPRRV
jgi:small subunit ribosomal protein S11